MVKHVIAASEMKPEEIRHLLDAAKALAPAYRTGQAPPLLQGRTVANLFFENSTRTRNSFEVATRRLGGGTINFSSAGSSVAKGETLLDTARTIQALGPHCLVVRHSSAGSPQFLARSIPLPVVNAGDGFHEHPTQALLDAYTMEEKLGTVRGKRVVILGDIAHSRVARSNIHVLKKLGASVAVCGPPTFLPPSPEVLGVDHAYRIEELLSDADVVMALRIQMERQNRMQIPSVAEYARVWGLNKERAALMKPGAIIMAPGPINRGVELDPEVADGPRSVVLDQVANGVIVRMAALAAVVNAKGLDEWLKRS
jgi:aspartate carbamoyltransferase catalytic subunit